MTSKFFGEGSSSSEASDSSSSEEELQATATAATRRKIARWESASSSEEEVAAKRVVRSSHDKRSEQLQKKARDLQNHMKVDDFAMLISDYEAIFKIREKLRAIMEQDWNENTFIKAIGSLEKYIAESHQKNEEKKAAGKKPLTRSKQTAFNTLRLKVRKGNREIEDKLNQFRENPDEFEDEPEELEQEEDMSSASEPAPSGSSSSGSSSGSSSSSDDSESDSDDDSYSSEGVSDSDSESWSTGSRRGSQRGCDDDEVRERKMLKWVITKKREEDAGRPAGRPAGRRPGGRPTAARKKTETCENNEEKTQDEEYTEESLKTKVTEITQSRGRKGFDCQLYADSLEALMPHAKEMAPRMELYLLSCMVSADFDNTGSAFAAMKIERWNEALNKVNRMLPLLIKSYKCKNEGESETAEDNPTLYSKQQELFVSFVDKLDDELYKAFQLAQDVYGSEYSDILANSSKYLVLLQRTSKFFEETHQTQPLASVALRLMYQLYYKPDTLNAAVYSSIYQDVPEEEKELWVWPEDSRAFMAQLCRHVLAAKDIKCQTKALLFQAYHLALHGSLQSGRDLLQLCNLQEKACESDVHIQILYNRVVAQLGLCAFRQGKIADTHVCLMELYTYNNRARELLAQGFSFARSDRTEEQARAERLRQLPYHMHINMDVLECVHHICAMLLEVPHLAMQAIDPTNKHVISRVLRRAIEKYDKSVFNGPPENNREAVVHAAKSLQCADWQSACSTLENLKIWEHIDTGHPESGQKIKEMIKEKVKVEAMRTYLFAYASIYDAFHLDQLVDMFNLPARKVHSVVSKMMIRDEITAFWDESSKYLLVQHVEPSPLQRLALALADKAAAAVGMNENLVDHRMGGYGFRDQARDGKGNKGVGRLNAADGKGQQRMGKGGYEDRKGKGRSKTRALPARSLGWENARFALGGSQRGGASSGNWRA